VARRTIYLPDSVEKLVRDQQQDDETFSATIVRLLQMGTRMAGHKHVPPYVASFDGPGDLGINAEKYLRELAEKWDEDPL
jgi:hypothetical protein